MAVTPVKISELTAAAALTGTEVAPVVQSGVTVKATTNQIRTLSQTAVVATAVAAAGSDQAGATLLALGTSNITSGSGGVRLPAIAGGESFYVFNGLATNLNVYPASGEQISGRTANLPLKVYPGTALRITGRASGQSIAAWDFTTNVATFSFFGGSNDAAFYIDESNGTNVVSEMNIHAPGFVFGTPSGQRAAVTSPATGQIRLGSFITGDSDFRTTFLATGVLNAVNYFNTIPAVAGSAPAMAVAGADTNIDLELTPKGTGNVRFGTHSAIAAETVTGYITIKDSAGNTRKLAVVS